MIVLARKSSHKKNKRTGAYYLAPAHFPVRLKKWGSQIFQFSETLEMCIFI